MLAHTYIHMYSFKIIISQLSKHIHPFLSFSSVQGPEPHHTQPNENQQSACPSIRHFGAGYDTIPIGGVWVFGWLRDLLVAYLCNLCTLIFLSDTSWNSQNSFKIERQWQPWTYGLLKFLCNSFSWL